MKIVLLIILILILFGACLVFAYVKESPVSCDGHCSTCHDICKDKKEEK